MLDEIVSQVKGYEGLTRKRSISPILEELSSVEDMGKTLRGFGEDCAVIEHEGGHLLLAAESIWSRLLDDPEWAGYCSVLTNVNDTYSMGGRPLAVVDTISFRDEREGRLLAQGMRRASEKFRVPVVGGHIHPEAKEPSISVCVLGAARRPLTSFECQAGDDIIVAVDIDGQMKEGFPNFDSTSNKSSDQLLLRLEAMVEIAEGGLASAAKDVSNPGVLGTIGMLLETSRIGAEIDVSRIPQPEGVGLVEWMLVYPGCGFILSCPERRTDEMLSILRNRSLSAQIVGRATQERKMTITLKDESRTLFDFEKEIITGAIANRVAGVGDD
jgi:selenophosphate synthetase-related protein